MASFFVAASTQRYRGAQPRQQVERFEHERPRAVAPDVFQGQQEPPVASPFEPLL